MAISSKYTGNNHGEWVRRWQERNSSQIRLKFEARKLLKVLNSNASAKKVEMRSGGRARGGEVRTSGDKSEARDPEAGAKQKLDFYVGDVLRVVSTSTQFAHALDKSTKLMSALSTFALAKTRQMATSNNSVASRVRNRVQPEILLRSVPAVFRETISAHS